MTKKLYEHGNDENLELFLFVKSATVRTAKNGKPYISFTFQDKSGQMDGQYWSANPEEIERFQAGTIVFLSGKRSLYNGTPQVKITALRPADPTRGEPSRIDQFLEKAPLTKEDMLEEFTETLFEITSAPINRIVRFIMNKFHKEFYEFPAAKRNHHAYVGGLSYHTISMLRLAKAIASQYEQVSKPLLYAGVILHDIGKTIELSGPFATEYTLNGQLLGHIVLLEEEISKACQELNIDENTEEVIVLKHLILAHHGKLEYGSPVRPQLLEAELLHQIDMIDASVNMIGTALQKTEPGEFSERIFGLDNRSFYKPLFEEKGK